jgi:deoxyguanosine kinase
MNIAFLGLGGNLGNRMAMLEKVVRDLGAEAGVVLQRSGVYESPAWGKDSPTRYLNMVIRIATPLAPLELLLCCQKIEKKHGRKRGPERYADRTCDIDVLYYNDLCIDSEQLQLPHPRLHLRKFVLAPLAQIAPEFKDPLQKAKVRKLLKHCSDSSEITFVGFLKPKLICVEGTIGSGKTTLAAQLAKDLKLLLIKEKFEKDHLVQHFYEHPKSALSVEFNFMLQRYFQLEAVQKQTKSCVCDFSFYRSVWFAAVTLSKNEFREFTRQFRHLNDYLLQPDLVILLNAEVDDLQKNIKKRGRTMEKGIGKSYLEKLQQSYAQNHLLPGIPLVTIDITRYSPETSSRLSRHVQKVLKENFAT